MHSVQAQTHRSLQIQQQNYNEESLQKTLWTNQFYPFPTENQNFEPALLNPYWTLSTQW